MLVSLVNVEIVSTPTQQWASGPLAESNLIAFA
jgi:hypothetical protein